MALNIRTEDLFNNFLKTAENIISHLDHDKVKRNDRLNTLKRIVEKHFVQDEKLKNVNNVVKDLIGNSKNDSNHEEVMQAFREKKNEMLELNPDVSQNSNYKEFCDQVKQIIDKVDGNSQENLDDDVEMTQDDVNVIDPFTKTRMTDPVKNKVCGHVYDRASVTSVVKMNPRTKCPVVGCIKKDAISLENLVTDIYTRKHIYHESSTVAAPLNSISVD